VHPNRRRPRALAARLLLALAIALPLAALVPGSAPATTATTADTWSVPRHAWVKISGHGYGHGRGMSQYGAEGAAREGLTYKQIIDFYYPNARWGEAKKRIAVLITADTSDDLVVKVRRGLRLHDAAENNVTRLPDLSGRDATMWRIRAGDDGRDRVAWFNGRWHLYGALDGRGGFSRTKGKPVTLVTPSGATAYRGRLWSRAPSAGGTARDTVNVVSLENYLRGVVPVEMPALWHPAAVRAQAVAARTYATYERAHPRARHYQICDTWSCQVYGGVAAEHPASDAAVEKTAGKVLTWRGEPALTQFASSSGGWTVSGSVPYLPAQKDPYDGWSGNSVHSWSLRLTDTQLESHWPSIGNLTRIAVLDRDGNGDWGGRVQSLRLVGSAGRVTVSGDTFRSVLGLRSDWITFGVRSR
jgi:SpoIID/LytB domain protein